TWRPTGRPLQDFAYSRDLAGNITTIRDRAPGSGLLDSPLGSDALDRMFVYDPLYRLTSATGRETDSPPGEPIWSSSPRSTDLTRARAYTERYTYDLVGNLVELSHFADGGTFTRRMTIGAAGNRLATVTIGGDVFAYSYDSCGNLLSETTSRHFEWDYANRMRVFRTQADGAEPSVYVHYLYDTAGERVKKLVRKQGGQTETTVYVDGLFEQH